MACPRPRISERARTEKTGGNDFSMSCELIVVDPEIQGGAPVFEGTRVRVKNLFEHLEAGESLDQFLSDVPSVHRHVALAFSSKRAKLSLPSSPCRRGATCRRWLSLGN